jgi:DNA mismatch repair protein MSH5
LCFHNPYSLEVRPSSEFGYESAKNKIANLNIGAATGPLIRFMVPGEGFHPAGPCATGLDDRQGQLLRLATWIDFDSRITVCFSNMLAM